MNHSDLIRVIGNTTFDKTSRRELALLTVVKMHKPQEITLPNGEWGSNCKTCDGYSYPCITISTIMEMLS